MKKIIVTGGAGYIGSHVCKLLKSSGYDPITIDNLSNGNISAVKWGKFYECDILDTDKLSIIIKEVAPFAIMHFAALAYIEDSILKPEIYYKNNVYGTWSLLQSMINNNIDKIIFSSTCAIYGSPLYIPIDEKHTKNPINPYGKTKYVVEQMLDDYFTARGINSVSLRYFNACGADLDNEIGETHSPEPHLIPNIIKAAYNNSVIGINGNNYETKDGTCVRDYIHVTDLANAHIKALKYLKLNDGSFKFNLGSEKGYSILEIIEYVENIIGKKINKKIMPRRIGDPPNLIANTALAKAELKWSPDLSDLHTIIETAASWYKKNN